MNAGTKLGQYEIAGALGAGGMGEVYRATQSSLERQVAIKVLDPSLSLNPDRLRRFEQEARAASALNHPNIISIYDVGREDGVCYIAMELVEGRTLRALLEAGPLAVKRTLQIAAQVADGLAKAHAAGIIHRDLKPENVMITRDGYAKILDFGLAKLGPAATDQEAETLSHVAPETNPGVVMGTVGYMSPEQARGAAIDFRSDIFSFGSMLYEMVTGKRPFKGESSAQTMAAIIEDDPQPVTEVNPKAPAPLRWIIERCLAKEPEERYASTRDLARDLANLRDHLSESASAIGGIEARPKSAAVSWRRWWAPAVIALVLGLAIGALMGWKAAPETSAPTLRALTFSGADVDPAVSPDGRMLAFTSFRDSSQRIWLKQLPDGGEVPLTAGPSDDSPRFAPDGSWILFTRQEGEKFSLYRVSVIGGDARKLLDDARAGDFSPDGQRVVFARPKGSGQARTDLGILNLQDGSQKIIHSFDFPVFFPRWSPDGSTIALLPVAVGTSGGSPEVLLLSADGSDVRKMESPYAGGELAALAWNGDGELIYSEPESRASLGPAPVGGAEGRIVLQNVRSGKARVVMSLPRLASWLTVAARGDLVLGVLELRGGLKEISLGGRGGEAAGRWLTRGGSVDRQPFYSRDGAAVLFASSRSGDVDLWEVSTKNNSLRRVTDNPAVDWDPFITPDDQRILFSSARSGHFEIWMAERDGSAPRQVTNDGYDAENPVETRDGWVIYVSSNPHHSGLWKVREDGSQASVMVPGLVAWPNLSPDGKFLLYHVITPRAAEVHILRLADGSAVGVVFAGSRARFTPDGKAVAYIERVVGNVGPKLFSVPFPPTAGAKPTLLFDSPDNPLETFAIAPDGKHAVLAVEDIAASLQMASGVEGIKAGSGK